MPIDDYFGLEPEREPDLLTSLGPMLSVIALVSLLAGFSFGQLIQSQFADIGTRNYMLARAVDQFDEAVTSADDLAASAQQNIRAVFGANGVSPEVPKPPEKKAEGDIDKAKGTTDTPQPAPTTPPFPPKLEIKGLDQLRAANDDVTRIRDRLNFEVTVPDDTVTNFSFFGEANARRNTHKVPVSSPKPAARISLSTTILVGLVLFLAWLTVYSLRMYARAPTAASRKLYERLSILLVTFFVLATVGMFGTYLGVKIVLPSTG
ncbi:hypothetical protein [Mesorhizobium sp. CO1-1-8]|uniref:hypothetical protein n=1 Tax=Mesorhizobium sp. CO1-1-8 TaxID=2876631 RepID=UPI001CD1041E|nr:hypothetical protein [Mesorhizobium sp. CO1-1-8]MBZ9772271.1 hypothetical protein [Mesorhizobium sp. CO1-1-8]